RVCPPPFEKPSDSIEYAGRLLELDAHGLAPMFGRHRQPRHARRETRGRRRVLPRHRRAASVPAFEGRPKLLAVRILQLFKRDVGLGQSELLALIDADRTAKR